MPTLRGEKELVLDQVGFNSSASFQEQTRPQIAATGTGVSGALAQGQSYGITGSQSGVAALGQHWKTSNFLHYNKVRTMRRHPTVKIVRMLSNACMALAKWSTETKNDAPDGAQEVVDDVRAMQSHILISALPGMFDFGWQPYEKILRFDMECGRTKLRKLKPLLQDHTRVMIDRNTGAYAGLTNQSKFLAVSNSLLLNQDVEGTYWYGESDMSAIETAYDRWVVTDRSNVQYDRKISGAHWIIHYPEGVSTYNGVSTDNFQIAQGFIKALEGSGSIAVPSTVLQATKDLNDANNEEAWRIELEAAMGTAQADFSSRMQYLDALMVRGGGFPERSILEGQYGTKAEAGEHADFAIARMDFRNRNLVDLLNWHLVNPLLRLNCGPKCNDKAFLTVAPIADDKKELLKAIFMALMSNPGTTSAIVNNLDIEAIRDQLQIPSKHHSGSDEDINNMLQALNEQDMQQDVQPPIDPQQQPQQNPAAKQMGV